MWEYFSCGSHHASILASSLQIHPSETSFKTEREWSSTITHNQTVSFNNMRRISSLNSRSKQTQVMLQDSLCRICLILQQRAADGLSSKLDQNFRCFTSKVDCFNFCASEAMVRINLQQHDKWVFNKKKKYLNFAQSFLIIFDWSHTVFTR